MSIVEMPELVLEKIIGFSNFKEVLTLRQVCRDFRNFIDDLKDSTLRDSTFTTIIIGSRKRNNTIILNFMNCDSFCFEYSATEDSRVFHSTTRIFEFEYCGCGNSRSGIDVEISKNHFKSVIFVF
ncbi:unnamed protein product [Caenorhabditis nigoni]